MINDESVAMAAGKGVVGLFVKVSIFERSILSIINPFLNFKLIFSQLEPFLVLCPILAGHYCNETILV